MLDQQPITTTTNTTNVLIVDDERTTRLAISESLNLLGYRCRSVGSGEDAIRVLSQDRYNVVLLDLEMPGLKGIDVLAAAEKIAPNTAFIILTAYASADTAILALRSGVVDYLRKPSSLTTIASAVAQAALKQQERVRQQKAMALLQQAVTTLHLSEAEVEEPASPSSVNALIHVDDIILDTQRQTVTYKKQTLDLTPIEYRLLYHLICKPDVICTYSQLGVSSHEVEMDEAEARGLLRTHMYRLVGKLGGKENSLLQSVWGRGFVLRSAPPG